MLVEYKRGRGPDSFSGAAPALRGLDQRVVDAPVDLEALAREARAVAIRALAGNADLVDAFLPHRDAETLPELEIRGP